MSGRLVQKEVDVEDEIMYVPSAIVYSVAQQINNVSSARMAWDDKD